MCILKQQRGLTKPQKTFFILSLIILVITLSACSTPEKRVALVIGNEDYQKFEKLGIDVDDAIAMTEALTISGFSVTLKNDLKLEELQDVIEDFNKEAQNADVAVFYYSGHGMQLKGINYLIPIGAVLTKPEDLDDQAVKLGSVLLLPRKRQGKRVNIKILDACRNNGFEIESRGLAEVFPDKETLVAFATSPGKTAKDNGFYAKAFLDAIKKFDGMRVQQIFDKVGQQIREDTKSYKTPQVPLYYTNISGDVYFVEKKHAKLIFTF